jgi:hypothetical protein
MGGGSGRSAIYFRDPDNTEARIFSAGNHVPKIIGCGFPPSRPRRHVPDTEVCRAFSGVGACRIHTPRESVICLRNKDQRDESMRTISRFLLRTWLPKCRHGYRRPVPRSRAPRAESPNPAAVRRNQTQGMERGTHSSSARSCAPRGEAAPRPGTSARTRQLTSQAWRFICHGTDP